MKNLNHTNRVYLLFGLKIALENQIDRLSTEYKGQLEIFNKLKSPDALENSRLKKFGLLIERKNLNFREKA